MHKFWKNTFDEEGWELLEATKEEVEQIIDIFIGDKIDPQVLLSNLEALSQADTPRRSIDIKPCSNIEALLQADTPYFKKTDKSVKSASCSILNSPKTQGGISFWSFVNRPRAIPLWFLAAYPDIMLWWDEWQEKHHCNSDDEMTEFMELFGMKVGDSLEDFINNKGKTPPKYLKNLIQSYKEITGKALETTVKNLEDDLYAGAEFLKMLGSESNSTFIAENTTKYYLELSKNYSDRFGSDASLLATAGILDAQGYIFIQQKINPQEIINMASTSIETKNDPLVEFIINLEIKLFGVDNPNMDIGDIKGVCEEQRPNIEKAIQKVKDDYISEPHFASNTNGLMQSHQFKSLRELIGIKE